jgi:hypothetical protein
MMLLLFTLIILTPAAADELVLEDGTRLQWKQIVDAGDFYDVETSSGKKIKVKKSDVLRFEKEVSKPLTGASFTLNKGALLENLLKRVDLEKTVSGLWTLEAGPTLITPAAPHGRLIIPFDFPAEYDLQITISKRRGEGAFYACLPVGDRRLMAFVDGTGGVEGGVNGVLDTYFKEKIFRDQKLRQLLYSVRADRFVMSIDGRVLVDYKKPDYSKLTLPDSVDTKRQGLMLGVYDTVYVISGLTVVYPKAKP